MNIQGSINKLLFALQQKGIIHKITTSKFYSEKKEKYFTKYQLMNKFEIPYYDEDEGKEKTKIKYIQLLETFNPIDVLKFLAKEYKDYLEDERENAEAEGSEANGE